MRKMKKGREVDGDFVGGGLESERTADCLRFLDAHNREDIEKIVLGEDPAIHYALVIQYHVLYGANCLLGNLLYELPAKVLQNFNDAAFALQKMVYEGMKGNTSASIKRDIHVRVDTQGAGLDRPGANPTISKIRVQDVGHLLTTNGTVIRTGAIKMLDGERVYECTKCKHRFKLYTDLELGSSIELPTTCPSERPNPCPGSKFRDTDTETRVRDYQEIRIQESTEALSIGTVPRSIAVILDDDLVDTVQAGDEVVVTGVLFSKWKYPAKDARCDLVHTIRANFIRKRNKLKLSIIASDEDVEQFVRFWTRFQDNPLKGRNLILQGICRQVFGLFTVKLAVALTLIGGVPHVNASGVRVRGESHLLLVGDPGTGKSQFLKYAVKLSHRPVLTTGLGSTSAGLTVTAVKEGGEWALEAGALVLADGGICCIDEFDSIREADRATIHEAMEQQTISIAKAGLVRTLSTRTTVIGVTNPKGQYDPYQSLTVNTTLSGPLLSRFDIVLVLLDTQNPQWDEIVSTHILNQHSSAAPPGDGTDFDGFWSLQMLRSYIHYVKNELMPTLTLDAENIITSYYQLQRRSALENAARTTVRMLESLIRLAQAHARLMFRKEVLRRDAIAAVICIESSMTTSAILDNVGNALHSTFTDNPDQEYVKQEEIIMTALNLDVTPNKICSSAVAGRKESGQGTTSSSHPHMPHSPARTSPARKLDDGKALLQNAIDEDVEMLAQRKRERAKEIIRPAGGGEAIGPSEHTAIKSQRVEPALRAGADHFPLTVAPPSNQAKHSTQQILEKLKGRGRPKNGGDQVDSRDKTRLSCEKTDPHHMSTEELLLSTTQYSLP